MILETSGEGLTLKEIIEKLGNKSYNFIECRCKWTDEYGKEQDGFFGSCAYDSKTGVLTSLDGDSYSLSDRYEEYAEWVETDEEFVDNGELVLTVWEKGTLKEG